MVRPFQVAHLDLMGPFRVKGVGGNSRSSFKAWAAVVACASTKAVAAWPMLGYATRDFLLAWSSHTSVYGHPSYVITDQGSQIVAAAGESPDSAKLRRAPASSCRRMLLFIMPMTRSASP